MELEDDSNEVLLDNFIVSTAQDGKSRGVVPYHLSKIWRISHEDAKRLLMSPPKHLIKQMIQPYQGITLPMIEC